jgi:hypothetical protein
MDDDEDEYLPDEGEMEDEEMDYDDLEDEEVFLRGGLSGKRRLRLDSARQHVLAAAC